MAITRNPEFSFPDRSNQTPSLKQNADGVRDIGWSDGLLSDGRPFRAEMWSMDGISSLTIFFSTAGIETLTREELLDLVKRENLVTFGSKTFFQPARINDAAGQDVWSLNIVVGDERETYIADSVPLWPYAR